MSTSAAGADPFAEDEDQQALRKLARDVAERELAPNARHWDETEEFPDASWDALRKADLFGITVGEQYGGMGMGDIEAAIALEELARADVSSAGGVPWGPARCSARRSSSRAPSSCVAISAAFHWSPWSSASGRPPTTRSLMYRTAYSSAP